MRDAYVVYAGGLWRNLGEDLLSAGERSQCWLHTGASSLFVLWSAIILIASLIGPGRGQRRWPRLRRDLRNSSSNWATCSRACQTWGPVNILDPIPINGLLVQEISELVSSCLSSPLRREKLATAIENDNYIKKLLNIFTVCEVCSGFFFFY